MESRHLDPADASYKAQSQQRQEGEGTLKMNELENEKVSMIYA